MSVYAQPLFADQSAPSLNIKQLERYLKQSFRFVVERVGDISYIQDPFLLLRVSTSELPAWIRPECDGAYEHWHGKVTLKEISLATYWQQFSARPIISTLRLTDQFDIVEKSKYYRLQDESQGVRWLAHQFLSLLSGFSSLCYELLDCPHAIRLMASEEMVAVIGERVDPEVERKELAQQMAEQHARIAAAWRRMEEEMLKEPIAPPEPTNNAFLDMVQEETMLPLTSTRREENVAVLQKRGIQPGKKVDDLFLTVTLPAGWHFQRSNDCWTKLIDDQGHLQANIFYKADPSNRLAWIAWMVSER